MFFGPLADVVRSLLRIGPGRGETTAHVYMSNGDASALENHTDVTEILVVQLLGRKAWLYCTADESVTRRNGSLPKRPFRQSSPSVRPTMLPR